VHCFGSWLASSSSPSALLLPSFSFKSCMWSSLFTITQHTRRWLTPIEEVFCGLLSTSYGPDQKRISKTQGCHKRWLIDSMTSGAIAGAPGLDSGWKPIYSLMSAGLTPGFQGQSHMADMRLGYGSRTGVPGIHRTIKGMKRRSDSGITRQEK
jgi:hypothetical protein